MIEVIINGYTLPAIYQGSVYKKTLDGELDGLTIVYQDSQLPPFKSHEIATVNGQKWVVGSYVSELVARAPKSYKITLFLIELTKLLERFLLGPCAFTNKNHTLYQQINRVIHKSLLLKQGEPLPFNFSEYDFDDLTQSYPGEEFFFESQMTLREVLDKMLGITRTRIRLMDIDANGIYYLSYQDLSRQSDDVKTIKDLIVGERQNQSMEYQSNDYETIVKNALAKEKRVITEEWNTLKPVNGTLADTDSVRLVVNNPIEEIIKVELKVKPISVGWSYQPSGFVEPGDYAYNLVFKLDISDLFIERDIYDTMTKPEQEKRIPYIRGDKNIGILEGYKKMFFTRLKLEEKIKELYQEPAKQALLDAGIILETARVVSIELDIDALYQNLLFQITYTPFLDLHYSQSKDSVNRPSLKSSMISNQTDGIIDIDRYAGSLASLANKLGEKVYEVDVHLDSVTDLLELGDRIEGDYTLISKEYSVFDRFVKCHYTFAQNFSNVLATKLSRERRLYRIPTENVVEYNFLHKEFLVLSLAPNPIDNGILSDAVTIRYFLKTFRNTDDANTPIDRIIFGTSAGSAQRGPFSLPLLGSAIGRSMHWQFSCFDNYSVGLSTAERVIGGRAVHQNPYVDDNGEADVLSVILINSKMDKFDYDTQIAIANNLPALNVQRIGMYSEVVFTHSADVLDSIDFIICKDAFEKLSGSFQLEAWVRDLDKGKIIVGDYLAKLSNLVNGKNETPLYIWASATESYMAGDTKKCKGTKTEYVPQLDTVNYGVTAGTVPQTSLKSWAIGTEDGRLVLAVNNEFQNAYVYFTISRDRV